jgi:hypothetical protein
LVSEHRVWLIDWAWPSLGAAWTDPACWVLRIMASGGHTPAQAEQQAARLPAFTDANPAHIDLFAAANVRLWDEIAHSSDSDWTGGDGPGRPRLARLMTAQASLGAPASYGSHSGGWLTVRHPGPSASPSADLGACQGGRPARWGTPKSGRF